jgi:UDPglucose 6-dehydrogenase
MKKIGIIGRGFVGTAVYEGMRHCFDILSYDKLKGWAGSVVGNETVSLTPPTINPYAFLLKSVDGPVFVCLPTPMNNEGQCDLGIVDDVMTQLNESAEYLGTRPVIILKSTVIPGTVERLNKTYRHLLVCFNPEFLTERNFIQDFKEQDRIIIGGPHEATAVVKQMYAVSYPNVQVTKTSSTIAEMVKYMTNCFLSVKVSFANEVKQVCDKLEIDYDKVIEYATKDTRLGTSHWSVPGPDGDCGFGGKCFSKDLNALMAKARDLGVEPTVMQAAWDKNLEVRKNLDWLVIPGAVTEDYKKTN